MMGKDRGKAGPSDWKVSAGNNGRLSQKRHRDRLKTIRPAFQIKSIQDARSPEILSYCVQRLLDGARWDELQAELGCGPAHQDKHWRELKQSLAENLYHQKMEAYLAKTYLETQVTIELTILELDQLNRKIDKAKGDKKFLKLSRLWISHWSKLNRLNERLYEKRLYLTSLMRRDRARMGHSLLAKQRP